MNKRRVEAIGWQVLAMAVTLSAGSPARAQDRTTSYRSMAPVEQYLMPTECGDRFGAQCGSGFHFARCHSDGSGAAWLHYRGEREKRFCVRGRTGLDVSLQCAAVLESEDAGSDLFQSGGRALDFAFDAEEDGAGAERTFKRSGEGRHSSCAENEGIPTLEPGAMSYMMSKQGYLGDGVGHWHSHLMFYVPLTKPSSWGADLPGSPVLLNPQFQGAPEPLTEFMIPVSVWSDGTPSEYKPAN